MTAKERKLTWLLAAMLVLFTSSAALASIPRSDTNPQLDRWAILDELAAVPPTPNNIDLDNEFLLQTALRRALPPVEIGSILPETRVWAFEVFDEISRPVPDELSRAVRQAYAGLVPELASDRTVLSPDPMGYRDSSNLYSFAGGDPINCTTPMGIAADTFHQFWNLGTHFRLSRSARGDREFGPFGTDPIALTVLRRGVA